MDFLDYNRLGEKAETDDFGKLVLQALGPATLTEWGRDPNVSYGIIPQKKSVFDSVEDTDSDYCLSLLTMLKHQLTA